ncbi:hypothetical protein PIB30_086843 [Stylosanthes scabra]|uniref:Aminoglycoside phosphotransferase domain-containing protein n=1 Tax=Stylosanthes scabra TaxID=79078 RepID=A0ABU6XV11_9FABA|nr:hypothetical protein [Stylosanthes scabra]
MFMLLLLVTTRGNTDDNEFKLDDMWSFVDCANSDKSLNDIIQNIEAVRSKFYKLKRLTEQVLFFDPYKVAQYNPWTFPYPDLDADAVPEDNLLKLEVAELKSKFCERAHALIHGDLHTGSVMVTGESTQFTDTKFAFYGPMVSILEHFWEIRFWLIFLMIDMQIKQMIEN